MCVRGVCVREKERAQLETETGNDGWAGALEKLRVRHELNCFLSFFMDGRRFGQDESALRTQNVSHQ
jgi:hypothetical protein